MYYARAMRLFLSHEVHGVPEEQLRKRATRFQGQPKKAPCVRELLFKWFCWHRRRVKGRLPLSHLLTEATRLRDSYALECLRQRVEPRVPVINYQWLKNWRREYNVSLRKPNTRWKVPRLVLKQRMKIMWSNVLRLQTLIWLHFEHFADVDGFDQKPLHVHESGSKNLKSLEHTNERNVTVKEGHAATRSRYTVVTYVTSNEKRARALCPLELCFKGGSGVLSALAGILKALKDEDGQIGEFLSLRATESASYKAGDVLAYLKVVLEEWTPARARANDWRILFCDAYSAHDSHAIRKLAWDRGYVMLYHGGGTTGVAQVLFITFPSYYVVTVSRNGACITEGFHTFALVEN